MMVGTNANAWKRTDTKFRAVICLNQTCFFFHLRNDRNYIARLLFSVRAKVYCLATRYCYDDMASKTTHDVSHALFHVEEKMSCVNV